VLQKLGLALASIAFALLCAELALRALERAQAPPAQAAPDPALAVLPELGTVFELAAPNQRGRLCGALWRTNAMGFRGPEPAPGPAPGRFRIALVGDSFAAGQCVAEEDTYAARLERLLDATRAAGDFEVLNLGLGGLNARDVVARARALGPALHPNLYVYGFTLNDAFEAGEDWAAGPPASTGMFERLLPAMHFSALARAAVPRLIGLASAFGPSSGYTKLILDAYADPEVGARLQRRFRDLRLLARRSRACAHVFVHTDVAALRFGHRFEPSYDRIVALARDAGLSASSSYPAFRGRDSSRLRVSLFDGHPNADGHRLLAESLYASLRELPPECGLPALPARSGA
jgi:lysophospholipase L1-like esterase